MLEDDAEPILNMSTSSPQAGEKPEENARLGLYPRLAEIYSLTNQAIQEISQADNIEQAVSVAGTALARSPLTCFQFVVDKEFLTSNGPLNQPGDEKDIRSEGPGDIRLRLSRVEQMLEKLSPLTISLDEQATLPSDLASLLFSAGLKSAALIPVWRNNRLYVLYLVGGQGEDEINPLTIQPYISLAGQVSTAIDKVQAMAHLHRRVAGLQSLASISQAISVVTDLNELYQLIHEKISQVMGELDLAIMLYDSKQDMISIPYAYEAGQEISLPPFPLGQGLTSILIRTQQPLMLVENAEQRAIELGAKITGASAKSWLGVPMIVSNEVMGAIIVQDTVRDHRFDMDDMRLLTTLASQVAITLRNISLYKEAQERAERERTISEINARIWSSPDVENIARTALKELCIALRATQGTIRLSRSFIDLPGSTATNTDLAGLNLE